MKLPWCNARELHSKQKFEERLLRVCAGRFRRRKNGDVMKILFLGEIGPGQTSLMRMRALERLGHTVQGVHTVEPWTQAPWLKRQVQRRLQRGSVVDEINRRVLERAREFRPELVWAEKQEFLRAETIEELRRLGAKTVHFTPDPYFSLDWKRTRLMDEAMRAFDALVYCKSYEREQYEATRQATGLYATRILR